MYIDLSIYLSIYLSIFIYFHIYIYMYMFLYLYLSIYMYIHISTVNRGREYLLEAEPGWDGSHERRRQPGCFVHFHTSCAVSQLVNLRSCVVSYLVNLRAGTSHTVNSVKSTYWRMGSTCWRRNQDGMAVTRGADSQYVLSSFAT